MAGFTKEQKQELVDIVKPMIDELALQMGKGFNEVTERFARMDDRFDRIEIRLDRVEGRLDSLEYKFDLMDQRVTKTEAAVIHHRLVAQAKA
ncbi:hypothetical protein EPO04_00655 [Patescibacteria group bacterium]|nr:MAG: hypothetical protein EPO04_00655 [Patescibacteria group bacterium]